MNLKSSMVMPVIVVTVISEFLLMVAAHLFYDPFEWIQNLGLSYFTPWSYVVMGVVLFMMVFLPSRWRVSFLILLCLTTFSAIRDYAAAFPILVLLTLAALIAVQWDYAYYVKAFSEITRLSRRKICIEHILDVLDDNKRVNSRVINSPLLKKDVLSVSAYASGRPQFKYLLTMRSCIKDVLIELAAKEIATLKTEMNTILSSPGIFRHFTINYDNSCYHWIKYSCKLFKKTHPRFDIPDDDYFFFDIFLGPVKDNVITCAILEFVSSIPRFKDCIGNWSDKTDFEKRLEVENVL